MPNRLTTFTADTLQDLVSAAGWNQWVDSWNAWLTFNGLTNLGHVAAGDRWFPAGPLIVLQQAVRGVCASYFQDLPAYDAYVTTPGFWLSHTFETARAAAGLSGSDWTRYWPREVASLTGGTYVDGDAWVVGEYALNRADDRVYLRGASSWTLQPRNTPPTIHQGWGTIVQGDIIGPHIFNELAAVHQVLYYQGGGLPSTWTDNGVQSGTSPGDFPPFSTGDPDAATAEADADAACAAATASFSGNAGTGTALPGDSGAGTRTSLAHNWTNSSRDWWQATRQLAPRKYGGAYSSNVAVGTTIELWSKIIRNGTEYEGPYAEDSLQMLGTVTRGAGASAGFIPVDLGSVSYPTVTASPYPTQTSATRGSQTSRSQTRYDVRPVLPPP